MMKFKHLCLALCIAAFGLATASPMTFAAATTRQDEALNPPDRSFTNLESPAISVALSHDNRFAAAGLANGSVHVWDLTTGRNTTFTGHHNGVTRVAFSRDGKRMASLSGIDGRVRVWDLASGQLIAILSTKTYVNIFSLAISPDGSKVAIGTTDLLGAWMFDVATEKMLYHIDVTPRANDLSFSSDGSELIIFIGGEFEANKPLDCSVKFYDVATGQLRRSIPRTLIAFSGGLSTDQSKLTVIDFEETSSREMMQVLDLKTGAVLNTVNYEKFPWAETLAVSENQQRLVGSEDILPVVMDVPSGKVIERIDIPETEMNAFQISADGECVLICGGGREDEGSRYWLSYKPHGVNGVYFRHIVPDPPAKKAPG